MILYYPCLILSTANCLPCLSSAPRKREDFIIINNLSRVLSLADVRADYTRDRLCARLKRWLLPFFLFFLSILSYRPDRKLNSTRRPCPPPFTKPRPKPQPALNYITIPARTGLVADRRRSTNLKPAVVTHGHLPCGAKSLALGVSRVQYKHLRPNLFIHVLCVPSHCALPLCLSKLLMSFYDVPTGSTLEPARVTLHTPV